ncbi:MAG: LPD7 domain-containing protein [Hydrogenophaga sp.]|uniref:LPD7 domain-containing protein n=1 Tax=Hydrogenophaga sp. TaxID=1904254 RepID=UPI003D0E991C
MDDKAAPSRRADRSASDAPASVGGTVEPADRALVAIRTFQTPEPEPGERYELRDPFADLTYRSDRYLDMTAKADQLGANRFVALDAKGQKSFVHKVDGQWQREEPREPQRPSPTTPPEKAAPEVAPSEASARLDAQAEREALVARLEAALTDRYIIKRAPVTLGDLNIGLTEYRFRGDTSRVAFTESTFRLATDTNSPSVARSMVDVAEARNWQSLRVTGNEDFRRMVWLEAAARGVKTLGYEPNLADQERLKVERELRQTNRIEPAREAGAAHGNNAADKPAGRGSGGRKTVLAAIEAILVANRVPEKRREAIMAAAEQKLAQRIREGQVPKVKLYDKNAPSQRPVVAPTQEQQRTRERAAPAR